MLHNGKDLKATEKMVRVDMKNTLAISRGRVEEMRYGPGTNILVPLAFAVACGLEYREEVVTPLSSRPVAVSGPTRKDEEESSEREKDAPRTPEEEEADTRAALFKEFDEAGDRDDLMKLAAEQKPPVDVRGTGANGYIKKDDIIHALIDRWFEARATTTPQE